MIGKMSPIEKLFQLHEIRSLINSDIREFWNGIITDKDRLVLDRDE